MCLTNLEKTHSSVVEVEGSKQHKCWRLGFSEGAASGKKARSSAIAHKCARILFLYEMIKQVELCSFYAGCAFADFLRLFR